MWTRCALPVVSFDQLRANGIMLGTLVAISLRMMVFIKSVNI
jgi:hypothetical protein